MMDSANASPDPTRADRLAYYLLKAVNKASREHALLADDDAILVAVSGGKDSLTLLDLLYRRQRVAPERYRLMAGLVTTDFHCGRAVPEDWLRAWCQAREIPLVVQRIQVAQELAATTSSRCYRCARNRRKTLFQMADRLGCNKLAFGHHADDMAETVLMNLLYHASLEGMEPRRSFFGGRLVVIRPLVYIEERDIVPFARASGYPLIGEPCPEGRDSQRATVKRLLREVERDCHHVKRNLYRAVDRYRTARADISEQPNPEGEDDRA